MNGVAYNIDKVQKGKAELIDSANFPPHCLLSQSVVSKCADYLDFLCKQRPDINSRQFHVTISVAGDELNKEQLKEVAHEYMEAMGYASQPYLVFFHRDTDNNHIHIVSTRVRLDKSLVPDGNERRKSLQTIKRICQEKGYTPLVTKKEEAAHAIEEVLNWKFKHEGAICTILALYGLEGRDDEKDPSKLNVYSGNRKVGVIEKELIQECIKAYRAGIGANNRKLPSADRPEMFRRKNVLFNKLNEYASKGFSLEEIMEFKEFRKMGFRLDYKATVDSKQQVHHQWTVTDFVSKTRFDGADVGIPIETLLRGPEYLQSAAHFQELINQVLEEEGPQCTWSTMQARLAAMNTNLKKASNAVSYSVDDKFFRYIDREQVKQLLYWERVASARKHKIHNPEEARVLAALHSVKLMDIIPNKFEPVDDIAYQQLLDELRGRFQTFLQAREQVLALQAKQEQAPDKKLSQQESNHLKVMKDTMDKLFDASKEEAIVKDGDRYFFYTSSVGLVELSEVVAQKLSDTELAALRRPVIDLAVLNRSQGRWLRYINQIIEEGGSVGIEQSQRKSGQERAQELEAAYVEAREAKKQEWKLKKEAMEARKRGYSGPKAGSVRASSKNSEDEGSPLMRNAMRPTYLRAILQICHDLQHAVGGGVAVTGSGRKRKRKRGEDDDEDE